MNLELNQTKSTNVVGFEITFKLSKAVQETSVFGSKFFSAWLFAAVLPKTKRNPENFYVFLTLISFFVTIFYD